MNARLAVVALNGKVLPIPRGISPLKIDVIWQGQRKSLRQWAAEGGKTSLKWLKKQVRTKTWPELVTNTHWCWVQWRGQRIRLVDLLAGHGVTRGAFAARLSLGWTFEEAILGRPRSYRKRGFKQPAENLAEIRAAFEAHIIEHPSGHWEVAGPESVNTFGYMAGAPGHRRRIRLTHRQAAWLLYRGDIAPGQFFRPTCGKRWCVRPEHLEPRKTNPHIAQALAEGQEAA